MLAALKAFPPGSAPGPSGLRPAHLKDCLERSSSSAPLLSGMLAFARTAVRGALHEKIAVPLCAANLVPLRKKDGGVRPIAVGDVIRRVVGKFLLKDSDVRIEVSALWPRQCGVGVPFAAEHVGMTVQAMARRGGSWGHDSMPVLARVLKQTVF